MTGCRVLVVGGDGTPGVGDDVTSGVGGDRMEGAEGDWLSRCCCWG